MIPKTTVAHIAPPPPPLPTLIRILQYNILHPPPLPTVICILQYICPFQSVTLQDSVRLFLSPPPSTPPGFVHFNWLNIFIPTSLFLFCYTDRTKQIQSGGGKFLGNRIAPPWDFFLTPLYITQSQTGDEFREHAKIVCFIWRHVTQSGSWRPDSSDKYFPQ